MPRVVRGAIEEARNVKTGTRCKCREPHHGRPEYDTDPEYCQRPAVRIVTVRHLEQPNSAPIWKRVSHVPMCEPCAQGHESKAGAR